MHILYLHQYFNTPKMSGSIRSYVLSQELLKLGHSVELVTTYREPDNSFKGWKTTNEDGIIVHWLYLPYSNRMSFLKRIIAFIKYAIYASLKARNIKADVIYATSTPLTIAIPGIFASKMNNTPMVFEVRDLWPEVPIAMGAIKGFFPVKITKWLEKIAYKNSKRIVALSDGMKEGIIKRGIKAEYVEVIPNISEIEIFYPSVERRNQFRSNYEWLGEKPLFVYTGTLGYVNGLQYIVELAAEVHKLNSDIRFMIIGDGIEREKVLDRAKKLNVLDTNLFYIPTLPKSMMPYVLTAADISSSFVIDIKELWPNSANKFFDSLAAGTPIAINHGGWQAEVINENQIGLVFNPLDVKKAATDLVQFILNKNALSEAGKKARYLAENYYSSKILSKKLENVLNVSIKK